MKTFLIIGAGEYGAHLAVNLCEMGNEVMLVDKNERIINELFLQNYCYGNRRLYNAQQFGSFGRL